MVSDCSVSVFLDLAIGGLEIRQPSEIIAAIVDNSTAHDTRQGGTTVAYFVFAQCLQLLTDINGPHLPWTEVYLTVPKRQSLH